MSLYLSQTLQDAYSQVVDSIRNSNGHFTLKFESADDKYFLA
jgi:hypothetical protein